MLCLSCGHEHDPVRDGRFCAACGMSVCDPPAHESPGGPAARRSASSPEPSEPPERRCGECGVPAFAPDAERCRACGAPLPLEEGWV
ncbi:MAG TPA: hypothetical protein VKN99_12535 [Polyangia bacterium]|nr:hypothetical protein [Polyangia bacterium]